MMTKDEFANALRLLHSIDSHELGDPDWYPDFCSHPHSYFVTCADDQADVIWQAMVKRGAVKVAREEPNEQASIAGL